MNDVVWEQPPEPVRAPRSRWARIADELRTRPGDWARVRECDGYGVARSVATAIRRGRRAGMEPAGSFEATVRPAGSRYAVYARYVGAQGGKAPTAGEQVPNRPGYVFSDCTHPVRATEWHAGERTCQPCQDAFAAEMSGGDQPLLLDPDCRDGKHGSCVGGLCECVCHEQDGGRSDG